MASSSKPQPLKKESVPVSIGKPGDILTTIPEIPNSPVRDGLLTPPMEELDSLSNLSHLTRQELLRRRLNNVKQLSKVYRDHYWASMEQIRGMYRDYYWKYGISPFKEDEERDTVGSVNVEGTGETNANNNCSFGGRNNSVGVSCGKLGLGFEEGGDIGLDLKYGGFNLCTFVGCKFKAMALTAFCHLHILSDPQQKLYKACNFVIKRAQAGPILCGKPILRSTVPSLCNVHIEKAQKHVTGALKKAGLTTSSSKLAPKFHVIVAEYVHQIKAKRRAFKRSGVRSMVIKEECIS